MILTIRYRVFLILWALLYMGPLVAGLAGFGWQMIPVFTAIFVLWLLIMRPGMWPKSAADWQTPSQIGKLLLWAAFQAVLVGFCFGVGRGIGGTMGTLATVPPWVPPLMSLMAIPLARLVWNPAATTPEMDAFLDHAIIEVNATNAALTAEQAGAEGLRQDTVARAQAACAPFIATLQNLSENTTDAEIEVILAGSRNAVHPMTLLDALENRAESGQITPQQRRAFILHATDLGSADRYLGNGYLAQAFDIAGEDAARLSLFAGRATALLTACPAAMMDTPTSARVRSVAGRHPQAEAALMALAAQMDTLDDD